MVTVALLSILGFAGYEARKHSAQSASRASIHAVKTEPPPAIAADKKAPSADTSGADRVLRITPDAVLASVNGHILTARDVFPPGSSNQNISLEVCDYYRHRAVDRELIFQTAKAQEVGLNESQQQQLANLQRLRQQQGPGLVRDLTGGTDHLTFELRDDEAFMLQTSLLEKLGASPNVTSKQVLDYYHEHASEFGALPADERAREEAWGGIDFKIRQTLAFGVRSDFQRQLTDYMNRITSGASIQLTPLASFASAR
jgi:hypothetical protein